MNIFEQYGIKEIADVCLYAIELDENDDEIYIPVLYMDTLRVSTVEETTQQTSAQGGIGNPKLITWDYGKDIVVTLEDALFTPASASMNWGGKLDAKGLQLSLQYFFDRNTDNNTPDTCLRTATLTVEKFSDFFIIPDRKPAHETYPCHCEKPEEGYDKEYVGQASIYCWLVDGFITSNTDRKRVSFEKLILFYREQTQRWYFFNSWELIKSLSEEETIEELTRLMNTYSQFSKETFNYIKENLAEYTEKVERVTWGPNEDSKPETPWFLTQNLYIDGYRKGCAKDKKYSEMTEIEYDFYKENKYLPYRYFANVGVEYNTNVAPPQNVIYDIDTAYKKVELIERIEKVQAPCCFCIDTDANLNHSNYRYITKYSQTELTVFIDPTTLQPYRPNSYEYYTKSGKRITGNLRIIRAGEYYYKWTRTKAKQHEALGSQLIIDPIHYPGTYRLVGETTKRDRFGMDHNYQFEIPLCKLHPDNKISLTTTGEPTVFNMKLTALRRADGVMMKLTEYETSPTQYCDNVSGSSDVSPFTSPNPVLNPEPWENKVGLASGIDITLEAASPRSIASTLVEEGYEQGFKKSTESPQEDVSNVAAHISGAADLGYKSVDGTWLTNMRQVLFAKDLSPDEFNALVQRGEED